MFNPLSPPKVTACNWIIVSSEFVILPYVGWGWSVDVQEAQLVPPVVQPPLPWPYDVFPIIAPSISTQPENVSGFLSGNASFTVAANGQPLNYQWRKDSVNISDGTGYAYNISNIQNTDAGSYDVYVYNSTGNVFSSAASLTILPTPTGV